MFCLLRNLKLRRGLISRPAWSFSVSSVEHIERNKAILASQIITTIEKSPLNQYRTYEPYPSLREKILEQIDAYKIDFDNKAEEKQITSAVKYALRSYFVQGVWVPYDMCSEIRWNQKRQSYSNLKIQKQSAEIYVSKQKEHQYLDTQFRKLRFCPTYFITGQIFRQIIQCYDFRFLTGQYGVGKTYSFILYSLLSQVIFKYRHQFSPNKSMQQLPLGIRGDIPKAFYWSVNKDQNYHDIHLVTKLFNRQYYELERDIMNQKGLQSIKNLLFTHFRIKTVLLMDQISELASILRNKLTYKLELLKFMVNVLKSHEQTHTPEFKSMIQDSLRCRRLPQDINIVNNLNLRKDANQIDKFDIPQNLDLKSNVEQNRQSINDYHQKYVDYKMILHCFICHKQFHSFMYLSSLDIEKYLLNKLQLVGSSKQSNIHRHSERIAYPVIFYGDAIISDTAEFIRFHLKGKWCNQLQRELTEQETDLLQAIQKISKKYLQKEQFSVFLPLNIKVAIQKQSDMSYNEFSEKNNMGLLDQHVKKQLQLIKNKSVEQLEIKLHDFLQKQLPTTDYEKAKYVILNELWGSSQQIIDKMLRQNSYDKFKSQIQTEKTKLLGLQRLQIQLPSQGLNKEWISSMPNTLFGLNYSENRLQCYVNPFILNQVIYSQRKKIYSGLLTVESRVFKLILGKKSAEGCAFETALIDILLNGQTSFTIKLSEKVTQKIYIEQIYPKLGGFIPIPSNNHQRYKDFHFLKSFIKNIEALQNDKNYKVSQKTNFMLLPVKSHWFQIQEQILKEKVADNFEENFKSNSKKIDFVICQIYSNSKQVKLNVFDPTINSNSSIKDKIKGFYEELGNFKDKYDLISINGEYYKFTINYIVLANDYVTEFNCKELLEQKLIDLSKQVTTITDPFKLEQSQKIINNLNKFKLKDYGTSCSITINQKYKSGKKVVHTISVVKLFEQTELECKNQSNVSVEMRLLELIKPSIQKKKKK